MNNSNTNLLNTIDNCQLFTGLDPALIQRAKKLAKIEKFEPNITIIREGETGDKLFFIAQGKVEVSQKLYFQIARNIRILKQGECFGELALLEPHNIRTATVRTANEPVICLTLNRSSFNSLVKIDAYFALRLGKMICERDYESLQRLKDDFGNAYKSTIAALGAIAEYKDPETGNHLNRVSTFTRELSLLLKGQQGFESIDEQFIELITLSSPLHDIGKVGIPDQILLKPGKLTTTEWEVMKQHTIFGAEAIKKILKNSCYPEFLGIGHNIALYHQEYWDGTGYPEGLRGDAIPIEARIMAVADVYDALRSVRPYKKPITHEKSKEIIINKRGSHFDPRIVDAFVQLESSFESIFNRSVLPI